MLRSACASLHDDDSSAMLLHASYGAYGNCADPVATNTCQMIRGMDVWYLQFLSGTKERNLMGGGEKTRVARHQ